MTMQCIPIFMYEAFFFVLCTFYITFSLCINRSQRVLCVFVAPATHFAGSSILSASKPA
jgi:hypothetical protein